jgi:hypothetical protein
MVAVKLSIYDLLADELPTWARVPGFEAHHSGVEVLGVEYMFSAVDGVTETPPCVEPPDCTFRESKLMGHTALSAEEVLAVVDRFRETWTNDTYDVLLRNCNHFTDALCRELLGSGIPRYVNRLARVASLMRCCIPKSMRTSTQALSPFTDTFVQTRISGGTPLSLSGGSTPSLMSSGGRSARRSEGWGAGGLPGPFTHAFSSDGWMLAGDGGFGFDRGLGGSYLGGGLLANEASTPTVNKPLRAGQHPGPLARDRFASHEVTPEKLEAPLRQQAAEVQADEATVPEVKQQAPEEQPQAAVSA